jgi:hypothetical protein
MHSHTKSRLYTAAFLLVIFATCMTCAYLEGGIAERVRRVHDQDAMIAACRENNVILQHRYDALANESDPITIIAAEARYQGGNNGR